MTMTLRAAVLLLLLAAVSSCGRKEPPPPPAPAGEVVTGAYAYGHNVNTFRPCGTSEVLWVEAPPAVLAHLEREYAVKAKAAFETVIVTARGTRGAQPAAGPGASYRGTFAMTELVSMRPLSGEECGEKP